MKLKLIPTYGSSFPDYIVGILIPFNFFNGTGGNGLNY